MSAPLPRTGGAQVEGRANLVLATSAAQRDTSARERRRPHSAGGGRRSGSRSGAGDGRGPRAARQTERTADALPHEMAALNALLKAQAEARRREVLRQQAGAGGNGSGRSGRTCPPCSIRNCNASSRRTTRQHERRISRQGADANDARSTGFGSRPATEDLRGRRQADLAGSGVSPEAIAA